MEARVAIGRAGSSDREEASRFIAGRHPEPGRGTTPAPRTTLIPPRYLMTTPDETCRPYIVFGAPTIGEEEIEEVGATLRSGWLGTGPKVRRFEEMFREYVGARHAV